MPHFFGSRITIIRASLSLTVLLVWTALQLGYDQPALLLDDARHTTPAAAIIDSAAQQQQQRAALQERSGKASTEQSLMHRLHDQTVPWSGQVHRVWIDNQQGSTVREQEPPAPAQLLLTNHGWNHPNKSVGLSFVRSTRSRLWVQGILNHPWFHPTAWEDYTAGLGDDDGTTHSSNKIRRPNRLLRYYIFLDVETCFESNWPVYGVKGGFRHNADERFDRNVSVRAARGACYGLHNRRCAPHLGRTIRQVRRANFPLQRTVLVIPDCLGDGQRDRWRHGIATSLKRSGGGPQLSLVTLSSSWQQLDMRYDQGLPPPPVKPVNLTREQIANIETCVDDRPMGNNNTKNTFSASKNRPYLMSFVGTFRKPARGAMRKLLKNESGVLILHRFKFEDPNFVNKTLPPAVRTFEGLLRSSLFAAAPRGDNLFSYRFAEVLSAGAIPVVYADDWVFPFRKELVDWESECAVLIPESSVNRTVRILKSISPEERCRRRRRCYEIYRRYMETHEGTVAGVIEGLERVFLGDSSKSGNSMHKKAKGHNAVEALVPKRSFLMRYWNTFQRYWIGWLLD